MTTRMRRARRVGDERGSISIWVVLVAPAMIILAGLAVDGGGKVHAEQRATHLAEQAARVGGQQLRTGDAIRGVRAAADTAKAAAAARTYLAAADVSGTVTVRGGDTVTVAVADTYDTVFLSIIGINRLSVSGSAQARTVRAVDGDER